MNKYTYVGPAMEFDRCIVNRWVASTYAPSKSKARSNLTYQFKKKNNLLATAKITLTGEIIAE